jgi:acetylglutamate kinase
MKPQMTPATVLKFGGELLEDAAAVAVAAATIVRLARAEPVVVVHGGGRAIDAELRTRGVAPRFADGVRVTDEPTLEAVISVLAGRTNTGLVAAVGAAGGRAVGLTGADGFIGLSKRAEEFAAVSGDRVDLGLVGNPIPGDMSLLRDLLQLGCIPIVSSIGVDAQGTLLNVNADVMAAHLAAMLGARRLIIAGTTAGVLDGNGAAIPELALDEIDRMAANGSAHSGMLAKLNACRRALVAGVGDVAIVSGRAATDITNAPGTRIVAGAVVNQA